MQLLAAYALGIKSVVVAVSQLDDASCSFGESRFREIEERMRMLLRKVPTSNFAACHLKCINGARQVGFNPHHVVFVPVAAVFGDCIVQRSPRISWSFSSLINTLQTPHLCSHVYVERRVQVRGAAAAVGDAGRARDAEVRGETSACVCPVQDARGRSRCGFVCARADGAVAHWNVTELVSRRLQS